MLVSNAIKMAMVGVVVAGTVVVVSSIRGEEDGREHVARLLRRGAQGARWLADKADRAADYLETQDSEEYVSQQWAKIERARQGRAG